MSVCVCCFCHSVDFLPGSQTSVIICDESLRYVSLEMNCYVGGISWVVLLQWCDGRTAEIAESAYSGPDPSKNKGDL